MQHGPVEMTKMPHRPPVISEYDHTRSSSPNTMNDIDITDIRENYSSHERLVSPGRDGNPPFGAYGKPPKKAGWWERLFLTRDLWSPSWNMYLFCIIGIGFAIGHHAFYASLEGKIVYGDDQLLMLRYGTALAFAAKASLVASVLAAFREQLWATVRSKYLYIATLDDMFAALETPFSLLNLEFLSHAKVLAVLALYGWLSPLIVILTTNTLIVKPATEIQDTKCPGIRNLNFTHEETNDFRMGTKINGLFELSLSLWNTTSHNQSDPQFFDYWLRPSFQIEELLTTATLIKRPFIDPNETFFVCEKGWNCTIEIKFIGPSYKCQEIARGVGSPNRSLRQQSGVSRAPFRSDPFEMLAPTGNYTYISHATHGDYVNRQLNDTGAAGIPKRPPPWPRSFGAFRTEPVIWVGYSEIVNSSIPPLENEKVPTSFNKKAWEPVLLACEHYEAACTAEFRYIDGEQRHHIKNRTFLAPIVNTTWVDVDANDGTEDNTTAIPESNYVLPTDVAKYRRTAAYYSIGKIFRSMINGTIREPFHDANTKAIQTSLIDPRSFYVYPDLKKQLETYYDSLLFSLFGNPRLLPVVWAAKPDMNTGTNKGDEYMYPCKRSRPAVAYYYRARILVPVYAISALFAIFGVAAGTVALRKNGGISRNTRFSSVLAAGRASCLNKVPWDGPQKDRGYISSDLMKQKLGYGILANHDGDDSGGAGYRDSRAEDPNYGFGFEGEVVQRWKT